MDDDEAKTPVFVPDDLCNLLREVKAEICSLVGVVVSRGLVTQKEYLKIKAACMARLDQDAEETLDRLGMRRNDEDDADA